MTPFARIKAEFGANWTTVRTGWQGLGVLSPWPERTLDSPPLLSPDDVEAYATERLAVAEPSERDLVEKLLSLDLHNERRQAILEYVTELSRRYGGDSSRELKKWQVVLLEERMETLPTDPLYGLLALTEFWASFGFPSDGPHEVQGRGNNQSPGEYYHPDNYRRLLARHEDWVKTQKAAIIGS